MTRVERVLKRLGIDARKRGSEWYAKCPNPDHNDHDPSWRIRDEDGGEKDGMHLCFPCGFKGGLVSLVAAVLGVDERAARAWLGGDAGVQRREVDAVDVHVRSARAFALPSGVEQTPLSEWPKSARVFMEARKVPAVQVDRWRIGVARRGPLACRIVIPYEDDAGRLLGYTARTYIDADPRYMEARPGHDGSSIGAMFGERHWPENAAREDLWITEGAFNALAVERSFNPQAVVALAGSQIRSQHAAKISTFRRWFIVTDPDAAGEKVAGALRDIAASFGIRVQRVELPPKVDADDLYRSDPQDLNRRLLGAYMKASPC